MIHVVSSFPRPGARRVGRVPPGPVMVFRASVLQGGAVLLFLMLVRLGPRTDDVYATWLNGCADHGGLEHLRKLAVQPRIAVLLHGDRHVERMFRFPNSLRVDFAKTAERIAGMPPWSEEEFSTARAAILRRRPTPIALWRSVGNDLPYSAGN